MARSRSLIAEDGSSSHEDTINILHQIDDFISANHTRSKLQRIGFAGLAIILEDIKVRISADRRRGRFTSKRGQRDASLALNLYQAAQGQSLHPQRVRRQLNARLARCRRWLALSNNCPLLLTVFGDFADEIMYVIIRVPKLVLPKLIKSVAVAHDE